jgi:hypothetical protein
VNSKGSEEARSQEKQKSPGFTIPSDGFFTKRDLLETENTNILREFQAV